MPRIGVISAGVTPKRSAMYGTSGMRMPNPNISMTATKKSVRIGDQMSWSKDRRRGIAGRAVNKPVAVSLPPSQAAHILVYARGVGNVQREPEKNRRATRDEVLAHCQPCALISMSADDRYRAPARQQARARASSPAATRRDDEWPSLWQCRAQSAPE